MKTTLGVGISVLSALVAQGKDFDRTELNAMLDRLAASPEPKIEPQAIAMCYKMALPKPEDFEYACPKCGTKTVYPQNRRARRRFLRTLRDGVASLKAKGLNIELDESCLCRDCGKDIPITIQAWVSRKYVSDAGQVLGDEVRVRLKADLASAIVGWLSKGESVKVLERQEGDPSDWVRIEWRQDEDAVRFGKLCWVINGRKVKTEPSDINLLSTFLDGKVILTGSRGAKSPLKKQFPRLRELLGAAKK